MQQIILDMEAAFGEMDQCFCNWLDACDAMHRTPDITARLEAANIAHERFLLARNKVIALLRQHQEALMEFRAIFAGIAGNV